MTERSARSGITVVSWLTELLAMFGSVVAVVATAWLVIVPGEFGRHADGQHDRAAGVD